MENPVPELPFCVVNMSSWMAPARGAAKRPHRRRRWRWMTSVTRLEMTRPRRNPKASLATSKTPKSGLEISADQGHPVRAGSPRLLDEPRSGCSAGEATLGRGGIDSDAAEWSGRHDAELMVVTATSAPNQNFLWCNVLQSENFRTESVEKSWSGVGLGGIEPPTSALSDSWLRSR